MQGKVRNQARRTDCLFCGRVMPPKRIKDGGKTDEHIIPKWLIKHLGIRGASFRPGQMDVRSRTIIHSRHHSVNSLVAGNVCSTCNGGWMAQLENEAEPLLKMLISDPHQIFGLTDVQRHIVARWTFKTAAVFNRASSFGNPANDLSRPVPVEHLRAICAGQVPKDVAVVGGGCRCERSFDYFQSDNWSGPANSVPLRPECQFRSYKVGLSFKDLLLAVAFYPDSEYHYGVMHGRYFPLWSGARGTVCAALEIEATPILSGSPVLESFVRAIFVVSRAWWALRENVERTRLVVPAGGPGSVMEYPAVAYF